MAAAALAVTLAFTLPFTPVVAATGRLAATSIDIMRTSSEMGHVRHGHTEHPPAVGIDDLLCLLDRVPFCPCTGQPSSLARIDELLARDLMRWRCVSVRGCFFC